MKKTLIIGLSGKKQSGKNTACNALQSLIEKEKSCKVYSYADALKEKICIDILGLSYEQCYGTDEQKNTLTSYKWNKMPKEIRDEMIITICHKDNGDFDGTLGGRGYSQEYMTAREVMQIVGTDIFRKYFDDFVWVNATFRNISKENFDVALICDVRFQSEVEGIIENGGYVIRLLRDVCDKDSHSSESALDDYDWEKSSNTIVLDNSNMNVEEQNKEIVKIYNFLIKKKV